MKPGINKRNTTIFQNLTFSRDNFKFVIYICGYDILLRDIRNNYHKHYKMEYTCTDILVLVCVWERERENKVLNVLQLQESYEIILLVKGNVAILGVCIYADY